MLVPFAHLLSLIVAVPEAAVEDCGQAFVPPVFFLFGVSAVEHARYGFLVARHHRVYIFRTAGAPLYLEHPYAGLHHTVDEAHGLQVFRTHDIFVVYLELVARLVVGHGVGAAAYLHALPAVG